MKLLYILNSLSDGGVSTVLTHRLNYLCEYSSFEIHVLSEGKNSNKAIKRINPKVKFHYLNMESLLNIKRFPIYGYFSLIRDLKHLYQDFIDNLRPDIISTFNFGYYPDIIPYIKTSAVKIIELHTSLVSKEFLRKNTFKYDVINFFRKNFKKLHNLYDVAICITEEDARDREYLRIEKKVIYNSIIPAKDVSDFGSRQNRIVAVGTLTHNKNFIALIKAANLAKDNLEGWKIEIYGEGEQRQYLDDLIHSYNLEEIISLKGFSNNLKAVYNDSKLLISTSLTEGFGMTILESLSYKVPVISYNCKCGPKEIILNNTNGILIDFDYELLAEKLKLLINDKHKLAHFSNNAVLSLPKFEFKLIMEKWVMLYEKLNQGKEI